MRALLTSILGGCIKENGTRIPTPLIEANGFTETLRKMWVDDARILIICADPRDHEKNDSIRSCMSRGLGMSGFDAASVELCDSRDPYIADEISRFDVIILTGGHVPTQNRFLKELRLKERLSEFNGILVGWSAGSMNCAKRVYAGPDLEGEAVDPEYERWIDGLGITDINIFPHYQNMREAYLDGLRMMEDITLPDSVGHEFLALTDGSYVEIDGEKATVHGEAYMIKDGEVFSLCKDNEAVILK